jgi:hypothetical protein
VDVAVAVWLTDPVVTESLVGSAEVDAGVLDAAELAEEVL